MTIDPQARVGHVHLTVSDLARALVFYRDALGFTVTARYGEDAVFLSAGGYHHHIGLNTWAGRGPRRPPTARPGCTTSPSSIRTEARSRGRSVACWIMGCVWKAPPTTE
jgi:catechol-2,3-dioxygenase